MTSLVWMVAGAVSRGYEFETGEPHLAYAHQDGKAPATDIRARTKAFDEAEQDMDALDRVAPGVSL